MNQAPFAWYQKYWHVQRIIYNNYDLSQFEITEALKTVIEIVKHDYETEEEI